MEKENNVDVSKTNFYNFVLNICSSNYRNITQASNLGENCYRPDL